jgi:pantoate--beta-alanine ligase
MSLELFQKPKDWMLRASDIDARGLSIGFVPTMGALHEGHLALVSKAKNENDFVLVSLFVNPTQFNDPSDFKNYPKNIEADIMLLKAAGVDYVFAPLAEDMYPDAFRFRVNENDVSKILDGQHRPGHFEGMLTVVLKLLNIASAQRAYFGEKDFQQLELVKEMAAAFFLKTSIVSCATERASDGLALSSRNDRLSLEDRKRAHLFPKILKQNKSPDQLRLELLNEGFEVDYVEEWRGRRLGAVRVGQVRLIDNVSLGDCI